MRKSRERENDTHIFMEPVASSLEKLRDNAREKRRILYDCFNTATDGKKVRCKNGYEFPHKKDGFPFLSTLRGMTPQICQECPDYDDGGDAIG